MCEANGVTLREMELADVSKVVEIENVSFTTPWSSYAFSCEVLDNNFAVYFVVTPDQDRDKVIGYGGMWIILDEAHITNIAIAPPYRGRRYGEILMLKLIEKAILRGAERITLEVRKSNKSAQTLYERLGFKEAGLRKGYYVDNNEDAVIMWKSLREGILE
ncbi:MAG: ribosomal protein S18-alanine N-acetyltransferase [Bacillota bacterium]